MKETLQTQRFAAFLHIKEMTKYREKLRRYADKVVHEMPKTFNNDKRIIKLE